MHDHFNPEPTGFTPCRYCEHWAGWVDGRRSVRCTARDLVVIHSWAEKGCAFWCYAPGTTDDIERGGRLPGKLGRSVDRARS